jgi:hypothetical protein
MKLKFLLLVVLVLGLWGCQGSGDLNDVIEAQECLDKVARTGVGNVDTCEAKVAGNMTPAAYGIRCSAGFYREGITASNLISAFSNIEVMNANNLTTFLSLISFNNAGTGTAGPVANNLSSAEQTFNNCASSLAKGSSIISAFSFLTNTLMNYSCANNGTPWVIATPATNGSCSASATDVANALGSIAAGGASNWASGNPVSSIGTIVINARTISCLTGTANETLCGFFNEAIQNAGGTGNPTAVGQAFVTILLNP